MFVQKYPFVRGSAPVSSRTLFSYLVGWFRDPCSIHSLITWHLHSQFPRSHLITSSHTIFFEFNSLCSPVLLNL